MSQKGEALFYIYSIFYFSYVNQLIQIDKPMSKNFKSGWYVLYVQLCHEKKVHNLLEENQLESFLPMIKTVREWSDRKKTIFKLLFLSYFFVKVSSSLEHHKSLSVDGAYRYVHFG
ncbi:hypothetical protein NBT05_09240 [Aquimarina sp. ERC-38]|uniref:transcription termination/antitermination NusG family protein n=1 Tax=Aquimarina sp. ERC-38 TaxID=2949996 RepID=UPI0022479334|nr:transcription termination/antitermination NusG family protein [Aquimarina sp. ERC-38]UZO79154.1 hypothetical protein NBT05_09240 [Aquimarina sp. ERC-38]